MKFLVDRMLGKLAKTLRMLGYDTIYYQGNDAYQMIQLARREGRVILTRSAKLVPKSPEDRILRVTEDKPFSQLRELVQKGYVSPEGENLLSRCLLCNALLDEILREDVEGKVPDFILYQQKEFSRCPQCRRIYWQGTHEKNMRKKLDELLLVESREQRA